MPGAHVLRGLTLFLKAQVDLGNCSLVLVLLFDSSISLSTARLTLVFGFMRAIHVPGVCHHKLEVVISVNTRGHVCVVLKELFFSNFTVRLGSMHGVVMDFKSLEEFKEDLLLILQAADD